MNGAGAIQIPDSLRSPAYDLQKSWGKGGHCARSSGAGWSGAPIHLPLATLGYSAQRNDCSRRYVIDAKTDERLRMEPDRITLAVCCRFDDPLCDGFTNVIVAREAPQRNANEIESSAHCERRLVIKDRTLYRPTHRNAS